MALMWLTLWFYNSAILYGFIVAHSVTALHGYIIWLHYVSLCVFFVSLHVDSLWTILWLEYMSPSLRLHMASFMSSLWLTLWFHHIWLHYVASLCLTLWLH